MNREQFFADCASSYPKAILAVAHFRDYVREECQEILNKHLKEIALAVGFLPDEIDVVGYAQPDQLTSANPHTLYLGAKGRRAGCNECVWAYIYWYRDKQEQPFKYGVGFDLWPTSSTNRAKYLAAMNVAVAKLLADDDWWGWDPDSVVSCYVELEENRLTSFGSELTRLITRVVEVVKSIDNVAKFFKK